MIFSDLSKYIERKAVNYTSVSEWRVVPYVTKDFEGKMLVAGECSFPEKIRIKLPIVGKFRLYFGLPKLWHSSISMIEVSFSKDNAKTCISPFKAAVGCWQSYEYIEESYFGEIDLTDNEIIINKPKAFSSPTISAISHIRLEKITDTISNAHNISYHFDTDFYCECDYESANEYVGRINCLSNGNGNRVVLETSFDGCEDNYKETVANILSRKNIDESYIKYLKNKEEIKSIQIRRAHELGMEIFSGYRLAMSNFEYPYSETTYNDDKLFERFSGCSLYTREGRITKFLSFAYLEVRKYVIDKIVSSSMGFDGVSLFFHRGMFLGFEKPILDRVEKLYGVDARLLPYSDKRLSNVYCEIMESFVRELREVLPNTIKIDVVTYVDPIISHNFGFDVAAWAKSGLIDSVSQGMMSCFEDLTGCLQANGLIDIERYTEENKKRAIVLRDYSDNINNIEQGAKQYLELLKDSSVEFFGALPWEGNMPERYLGHAMVLKKIGVRKFLSWNANHICRCLPTLNAVKDCGLIVQVEKLEEKEYMKYYRVLSLDGSDISSFDPNWRG